jgi:hypothetical protein
MHRRCNGYYNTNMIFLPHRGGFDDFLFVLDSMNSTSTLMKADDAFNELGVPMDANKQEGRLLVWFILATHSIQSQ